MSCSWKPNWSETQQHLVSWWKHAGLVLGSFGMTAGPRPHEAAPDPGPVSLEESYCSSLWRACHNHYALAQRAFPGDMLPISNVDIGPGSLALYLGSEPTIAPDTVWFNRIDPQQLAQPIRFDPQNHWWQISRDSLKQSKRLGEGKYLVGCPDLVENLDILASLRGVEPLLEDLVDRPGFVTEKVAEINQAWYEVYTQVYEILREPDGSSTFGAFCLWGPGKTAKLQCDFSALISPRMFKKFVVPVLTEQCRWLDHAMYHLDGSHCICHLDALLAIEDLDAIEWTPNPIVPTGGNPAWYEMYRSILAAGKSVQAVGVKPHEVLPLLDAVGGKGMYLAVDFETQAQYEKIYQQVEPYRNI